MIRPVTAWAPDQAWPGGAVVLFSGYLWMGLEDLARGSGAPGIDVRWVRLAPLTPAPPPTDWTATITGLTNRITALEAAPSAAPTFSPVVMYSSGGDELGNYASGCEFVTTAAISVSGIRFRRFGYGGNIVCTLWVGGSALASTSVTVTGAGLYSVTFAPVALAAKTPFITATFDGGTRYARTNKADWEGSGPFAFGEKVLLTRPGAYQNSGSVQPSTFSDVERFPVEPIYT